MASKAAQIEAAEALEEPYDASNPEVVNKRRKEVGRKTKEEREFLTTMMQNDLGRRFMYDSVKCIFDGDPLVPGDPYSTYFNLGQERKARQVLKEMLRVTPKEFILMVDECLDQ